MTGSATRAAELHHPEDPAAAAASEQRISAGAVAALLDLLNSQGPADHDEFRHIIEQEHLTTAAEQSVLTRLLRIRSHLDRAERRRDELAALFASSDELAQQRDMDSLLRRLTQRAQALLGADLAWLTQFDPVSGESVVTSVNGSVSHELEGLRVPPGRGMAWYIVSERRTHPATSYHADSTFPHDAGADRVLVAEGVVSALGVPLVAADEVVGTLVVAVRNEMRFHPDQVGLLNAFAGHAAAIVHGARLLDNARTSAQEAERSRGELAGCIDAMERAHAACAAMTACVARGEDATEVITTLRSALQRNVIAVDETGASFAPRQDHRTLTGSLAEAALRESANTGRYVPVSDGSFAGVAAVTTGSAPLGALLVERGAQPLGAIERKTVEDAARVMALLRLNQRALADAEERVRGELLSNLLESESAETDELRVRARARGLELDSLRRIVVVGVTAEKRLDALHTAKSIVGRDGLAAEYGGNIVMALGDSCENDVVSIWRSLRGRLLDVDVLAVEAPASTAIYEFPARHREAVRCLRLLPELGITNLGTRTAPYSIYANVFNPSNQDIGEFVADVIGPLIASDDDRGTELVRTVQTFAECNASATRTARSMHLHPNTVAQRLERVSSLLGPDWRDPDRFFRVHAASRLFILRQTLFPWPA